MILLAIFWLVCLAILVELIHRAPEIPWHD
jgi:hypothetical protein